MVHYPINGLDISEFYCRTEYDPEFRPIYDLYAVVNHYGGMFGGHYTAFAKSSNNFENLGINRLLINKIIYYFKFWIIISSFNEKVGVLSMTVVSKT